MKKMTTKIMAATLAMVLAAAMTACGNGNDNTSTPSTPSSPSSTPTTPPASNSPSSLPETSTPEVGQYDTNAMRYHNAITGARDTELNEAHGIFTHDQAFNMNNWSGTYGELKNENGTAYTEEQLSQRHNEDQDMWFSLLGFTAADCESYAISISPVNTRAYGVAVVKPVAGKEEVVKAGLESFLETQRKNFENYLPDQYEIAKAGYVKTLEDGTYVMVLSEEQDTVFESISKGLTAQ